MIVLRFINRFMLTVLIACVVLVGSTAVCYAQEAGSPTGVLQADGELQWFRGNMHTHSHWSDGDDYLEMIALWYRDNGYQFLVFTDHNVLANTERWVNVEKSKGGLEAFEKLKAKFPQFVRERMVVKEPVIKRADTEEDTTTEESIPEEKVLEVRLRTFEEVFQQFDEPGKFLLVQGEEISDRFETFPIHLNVSNVAELIEPKGGEKCRRHDSKQHPCGHGSAGKDGAADDRPCESSELWLCDNGRGLDADSRRSFLRGLQWASRRGQYRR